MANMRYMSCTYYNNSKIVARYYYNLAVESVGNFGDKLTPREHIAHFQEQCSEAINKAFSEGTAKTFRTELAMIEVKHITKAKDTPIPYTSIEPPSKSHLRYVEDTGGSPRGGRHQKKSHLRNET